MQHFLRNIYFLKEYLFIKKEKKSIINFFNQQLLPATCEGSINVCLETLISLLSRWMVSS